MRRGQGTEKRFRLCGQLSFVSELIQFPVPVIEEGIRSDHKQVEKIQCQNIIDISACKLAADAEDVADHNGILEHDAFSLRGFRTDGLGQIHRPGAAEADEHECFE